MITGVALAGLVTVGGNYLIHRRYPLVLPHTKAAVTMDAWTGQIVYQKNEDQHRLTASTGKLMDRT